MNKWCLHIEGAAVLALSLYFFWHNEFSWLLFFLLLFAPDLSMIGYIYNTKIGAILYNLFHTYIITIVVIVLGLLFKIPILLAIGLIWSAHIGMDRMIGYGLKYPTSFKDTHLSRI